MRHEPPDIVLFDLGGVLVNLSGVPAMKALSGLSEPALWERWLSCPWVRDYERGRCDAGAFASGVVNSWGLAVAPEDFLASFARWPTGLLPGAPELVEATAVRVRVGCLSNTNDLHWDTQPGSGVLKQLFAERAFLSHELGCIKPDAEIFEHTVAELGVAPERILFLDDNELNVEGARRAGLCSEVVRGVELARAALAAYGVL